MHTVSCGMVFTVKTLVGVSLHGGFHLVGRDLRWQDDLSIASKGNYQFPRNICWR
jgi:hypothetical protein